MHRAIRLMPLARCGGIIQVHQSFLAAHSSLQYLHIEPVFAFGAPLDHSSPELSNEQGTPS
jgi:hypothetical protein